jgi:hypothetical protein
MVFVLFIVHEVGQPYEKGSGFLNIEHNLAQLVSCVSSAIEKGLARRFKNVSYKNQFSYNFLLMQKKQKKIRVKVVFASFFFPVCVKLERRLKSQRLHFSKMATIRWHATAQNSVALPTSIRRSVDWVSTQRASFEG